MGIDLPFYPKVSNLYVVALETASASPADKSISHTVLACPSNQGRCNALSKDRSYKAMYLPAFQFLLVLSALANFRGSCVEDVACHSTDSQDLTVHHEDAHQVPLQPESSRLPFAGSVPLTADGLIALVRKDFADPLPVSVHVQEIMEHIVGTLDHWGKSAPLSWLFYVDVRVPLMTTCKPVIRGAIRLSKGIACGQSSCSHSTRFKVTQSYTATEGVRIETSLTVGAGGKGVEASISTSKERFWEKSWTQGSEQEVEYTFNLGPNQRCTPAMAHVELECDVAFDTIFYDSYFRRPRDFTDLEYRYQRKGGPFSDGQWCFVQPVQNWPLQQNGDWNEVLPNDGFDGNRGDIWKRPASEMNRWRIGTPRRAIRDTDIIIRRARGSGGNQQEVFVCERNLRNRHRERITVPLSSEVGALPGYIGCIT